MFILAGTSNGKNIFEIALIALIILAVLYILIWLIVRKFKLWYWKIDKNIQNQELQIEIMYDILNELRMQNTHQNINTNQEKSTP